ncbi:MAG: HAMP domain-containing histidine kinase [Lachnospiraceae bacterium]|nr:HAMP domain-containing histidine kinase [Lachnospiraceae bacterium]
MIMLWIACGLLTAGFIVLLFKWILLKRDIRQLGIKLNEIIHTDTNARLSTHTFDKDIINLAEGINHMLTKHRQGYLEANRLENDLKRAVTNISHDLRTPLTSAKGYLQMAENKELDEETLLRYLSIIRGRLDSLSILMDSLFAFSRAVEGDVTLQRVNISNILRDTLVASYAEIEGKGFDVESDIPDSTVYCFCDEDALKRVLQNLISNAVVHGNSNLRVRLLDGVIEIANKIDEPHKIDIHNIFERFYTADASRTNKRTGLGLAIAKELTEKMGGCISAIKEENMLVMRVRLPMA